MRPGSPTSPCGLRWASCFAIYLRWQSCEAQQREAGWWTDRGQTGHWVLTISLPIPEVVERSASLRVRTVWKDSTHCTSDQRGIGCYKKLLPFEHWFCVRSDRRSGGWRIKGNNEFQTSGNDLLVPSGERRLPYRKHVTCEGFGHFVSVTPFVAATI